MTGPAWACYVASAVICGAAGGHLFTVWWTTRHLRGANR